MKPKDNFYSITGDDISLALDVEDKQAITPAEFLGGHTNINLKLGNMLIKKIVYGNIDFVDRAYTELAEKKLFGVMHYQRFDNLLFLSFIEGYVTEDISVKEFMYLSDKIKKCGLTPTTTLTEIFDKYNFSPVKELYAPLLEDIVHVSHGDLAYINIVRTENEIVPIDWEFLCYSTRYWDLACFLASLYVYEHATNEEIRLKTEEVADPRMAALSVMLLCEYWIRFGITTQNHFYPKELKDLRDYLSKFI